MDSKGDQTNCNSMRVREVFIEINRLSIQISKGEVVFTRGSKGQDNMEQEGKAFCSSPN